MDLNCLKRAVEFIDQNLHQNIQLDDIAKEAGYSKFHFDRIFKYTIGESLIEYVRKRKLTEAASELLSTDTRIIEIALKYGFSSQQSFSMTFKKYFGKTPHQYRRERHRLILLEKTSLSLKEIEKVMLTHRQKVRQVTKDTFKVMGYEYYGSNQNDEIKILWNRFSKTLHSEPALNSNRVTDVETYLGVCEHVEAYDPEKSVFSYLVCLEINQIPNIVPEDMVIKEIPTQDYVVFTHIGSPNSLEATYQYIYGTYFYKTDFELVDAPDFELYDHRFSPESPTSELDIYIPVRRP